MKIIGIDCRLYYQTGVGTYIRNLLYYLDKLKPKQFKFIAYVLDEDLNKISKVYRNIIFKGVNSKWHTFEEQTNFLNEILKSNLDLMHFTYFSYPIFYTKKYLSTVHDTTLLKFITGKASTKSLFVYYFKHFIFKKLFKNQLKKSIAIITPTLSVKRQLLKMCSFIKDDKIFPIFEGVTHEYLNIKSDNKIKTNKNKYFLYIGTFYPHKNVENLLKAYSKLKTNIKLYLVGPDDYFIKKIIELINILKLNNKIKILKNIQSKELPDLYQNAQALIHPSKSEGFGLPIIEAAFFGTQIIASDIDVFNEILNGRFVKFDPNNIGDIKSKIESFIKKRTNYEYSDLMSKFSFEKMTKKTLALYSDILNI